MSTQFTDPDTNFAAMPATYPAVMSAMNCQLAPAAVPAL